jgi:hypothetical protein
MAEVFGVAAEVAYEATALANPSILADQLGDVVAADVNNRHDPQDSMDPAIAQDVFASAQEVDWAIQPPEARLAATGFYLGQLARLGFATALTPKESFNG